MWIRLILLARMLVSKPAVVAAETIPHRGSPVGERPSQIASAASICSGLAARRGVRSLDLVISLRGSA